MNHPNSSQLAAVKTIGKAPVALSISLAALFVASSLPAFAQLPPVNMGRWVKQPGDNQYSSDTQQSRHGGGQPVHQVVAPQTAVIPQQSAPVWRPTPKAFRSDVSLDPIVCDEPIPPVGFAPLPESLDLPGIRGGSSGFTRSPAGGFGGGGGAGGFSSSYQGSAPGMGGGGNAAPEVRSSQGYNSVQPGAFVKKKTPYGNANNHPPGSFGGGGSGGGDVYSSGDGAAPMSEAQRQMNSMGREPSLSNKSSSAPEAPAAVQINQATTQDLSLPDDEYKQSKGGNKSTSQAGKMVKRMARRAGRSMLQPLNSMQMPRFPMK